MSTLTLSTSTDDADPPPPPDSALVVGVSADAPSLKSDESCTTASLLQYYDDCAEYYDQTDEGTEDTYICVDRVTAALRRVYAQQLRGTLMMPQLKSLSILASSSNDDLVIPSDAGTASPTASDLTTTSSGSNTSISIDGDKLETASSIDADDRASISSASSPSPSAESMAAVKLDTMNDDTASSSPQSPRTITPTTSVSEPTTPRAHESASSSPIPIRAVPASASSPVLFPSSSTAPLRVLDLGVGTGLASRPLFSHFSSPPMSVPRRSTIGEQKLRVPNDTIIPEIWGVDLSPNMLRVSSVLPFAHLIAGDLNTNLADPALYPTSPLTQLEPGYFDVVVCVGTTEFVSNLNAFFDLVNHFMRSPSSSSDADSAASSSPSYFCGTFPSNKTITYPSMNWTTIDELTTIVESKQMTVIDIQQYRGWSVSAEEHVEYIQLLVSKRR